MVVITLASTRALQEEGLSDTGDLEEELDLCTVITGVSCYASPLEVNREYHTLFVCFSKEKKHWLEMNDNYLLIPVSRKPVSHFPHTVQLQGQREYCIWKCKGLSFCCLQGFVEKEHLFLFHYPFYFLLF